MPRNPNQPDNPPVVADTASLGGADVPETSDAAPPAKPSPDWAKEGPNGERPNLRLAHTPPGPLRAIHGERYPAVAYVRGDEVEYGLPVTDAGEPDAELQAAGFYSAFADRVCRLCPHYVLIKE